MFPLDELDWSEAVRLQRGARIAQKTEQESINEIEEALTSTNDVAAKRIASGLPPSLDDIDVDELLLNMAERALAASIRVQPKVPAPLPAPNARLSASQNGKKPPTVRRIPRTPAELTAWIDHWRRQKKKGKLPPGMQKLAKVIKEKYLAALQKVYKRADADFRNGKAWTQEQAVYEVNQATKVPFKRARMIVATETTRYYNEARRAMYDDEDGVTHYLFLAIRDKRTTPWCKTRNGLVYKKNTAILEKETPPLHPYCRSEITPLTPDNPRHLRMINNPKRARENHHPKPLIKGWNE